MILNINKPKDWTSFDVVAKIRGILRSQQTPNEHGKKPKMKVGHAGTLDPLATGVVLVLTGSDTKNQDKLMVTNKEYIAKISFGAVTDSYDLELPLKLNSPAPLLSDLETKLPNALKTFIGEIQQTVPFYSAVKVKGQPLYKSARKNPHKNKDAPKNLPVKTVTIYDIKVISFENETITQDSKDYTFPSLTCKVICSKGTYIRSLAYDLGQELGTGGVLASLVRTKVGTYTIEDAISIQEFEDSQKS